MEHPFERNKNDGNFASCTTHSDTVSHIFFSLGWILTSTKPNNNNNNNNK
jgi:hypothetical protein